jgi:ribosomal protein S18 acetylase RimI-like enzyme
VALQLRPIEDEEFAAWLPLLREDYAQDLVRDYRMAADKAGAQAVAEIDGHRPAGHSVGHLWLVERRDAYGPTMVVYDIDVDEPYRGRGYGRAAMVFAEEEARRRGLTRIALHVGARNEVARNLYRSLGFEENEVAMSKPI